MQQNRFRAVLGKVNAPREATIRGELDATLMELASLAVTLRGDDRLRDLALLAGALSSTLTKAATSLTQAERLMHRAAEMSSFGAEAWSEMLEGVACGSPPRAERLERCETSYAEARTLEQHAESRLAESRRAAVLTHASAVLWMESLRAKVAYRAEMLWAGAAA